MTDDEGLKVFSGGFPLLLTGPDMPRKKKDEKKTKVTYVALVIDTSSSMGHLAEKAKVSVNEQLKALSSVPQNDDNQSVFYTVVSFDSRVEVMVPTQNIDNYAPMVSYPTRGSTALRDGVKRATEELEGFAARMSGKNDDVAFLVVTFTDGEENVSITSQSQFRQLMAEREAKGNWTYTFQLPPRAGDSFSRLQGVNRDNIREWEQTTKGMEEATSAVTQGFTQYFGARQVGVKQLRNFYQPVTTDLSAVKKTTLKKELTDLSSKFKTFTVPTEQPVKEFVEARTRKDYVVGQCFYQLMKNEKVQPSKSVLIMEKSTGKVWGGSEARELIGLPVDGVTHAKVTPGNHMGLEIFIQSTSVNRILPRGTKILVDPAMTKGLKPTWEAPAAN